MVKLAITTEESARDTALRKATPEQFVPFLGSTNTRFSRPTGNALPLMTVAWPSVVAVATIHHT